MTISLADIKFENDFFSLSLPSGDTLNLNKVQEDFIVDGKECVVNNINLYITSSDTEEQTSCSSVIGMSNDYFKLTSNYPDYLGKLLTAENMQYCTIEVADE